MRRFEFGSFVFKMLLINVNVPPHQIIGKYLNENVIDCFSPSKRYLNQTIRNMKMKKYGKIPQKIKEINLNILKELTPIFDFYEVEYDYEGEKATALILISEKQKEMLLSEECVLMGDGTFCYVPDFFCSCL